MVLIDKLIGQYVQDHSSQEDPLLVELDRVTHLSSVQPRMISGHIQGLILNMIVAMNRPLRVLEIGTFTGYSAICIARALPKDGLLYTIDINDEISHIAESFFERAKVIDKVRYHIGSALDVVPTLGEKFDLVFIDGDKREYTQYYNMLFDGGFLNKGAFILADNVLWDGKVVQQMTDKNLKDKYLQGIMEFNDLVVADSRVEVVIMPFRDGMTIIKTL